MAKLNRNLTESMTIKQISLRTSIKCVQLSIRESTGEIDSLYLRHLSTSNLLGEKGKVIYINLFQCEFNEDGKLIQYGNFIDYYSLFDFKGYVCFKNDNEKRNYILQYIHNSFIHLCEKLHWDKIPFHLAYQKCLENGIKYDGFFLKKLILSPDKKHYFGLYYVCNIGSYDVYEILYDNKKKELARRQIYHSNAMVFIINWSSWEGSNDTFFYRFKGPKKTFSSNINSLLANEPVDYDKPDSVYFK